MNRQWRLQLLALFLSQQSHTTTAFGGKHISTKITPLQAAAPSSDEDKIKTLRALLISSYNEGVLKSEEAQEFLRESLLLSMVRQEAARLEDEVKESVLYSPCNGPNPESLEALEQIDDLLKHPEQLLETLEEPVLRFVYVPTAMYAIRPDSNNPPGVQRQKARAVGKQRREVISKHLNKLLGDSVSVHAVTLDLDDGSIKQVYGADSPECFPKNGREALGDWKPHFVYVEGGNTFWLHHCMEKGGWAQSLVDAVTGDEAAVYCGKSAGAILAGGRIDTATWKEWDDPSVVPGKENYVDWENTTGLDLIGGPSVFPHMDDKYSSLVAAKEPTIDTSVYCLTNAEICLLDGEKQSVSVVSAASA